MLCCLFFFVIIWKIYFYYFYYYYGVLFVFNYFIFYFSKYNKLHKNLSKKKTHHDNTKGNHIPQQGGPMAPEPATYYWSCVINQHFAQRVMLLSALRGGCARENAGNIRCARVVQNPISQRWFLGVYRF